MWCRAVGVVSAGLELCAASVRAASSLVSVLGKAGQEAVPSCSSKARTCVGVGKVMGIVFVRWQRSNRALMLLCVVSRWAVHGACVG